MKSVNDQFAEMQKKTMESFGPMQNMNTVAAEAFERIARKNYDLMGDLVEYAVAQVKMPSGEADVQQVYEQRVAETKAFADKVNARAAEYVALAGELGEMVSTNTSTATQASANPAKAKPAKAKPAGPKSKAAPAKSKAAPAKSKAAPAKSKATAAKSKTPAEKKSSNQNAS